MSNAARLLRSLALGAAVAAISATGGTALYSSNVSTAVLSLPFEGADADVPSRPHSFVAALPADEPAANAAARPANEPVAANANVPPAPERAVATTDGCGANAFCYPRLDIAGTIVPYRDCTGSSDVGTQIRSLSCVSDHYLAAHAYTQFGRIWGWRSGDIVYAYSERFVVYDAFTQPGCVKPARALAALSLQTSLTSRTCGPILVVQARRG